MRITTANAYATAVDNLQQRQQDLQLAQERLTSGKRVARASDDPAAAARAERALASQRARRGQPARRCEASRSAMQQAEGALGDATEAMQQARELLVAAGNGSYSDAERADLARASAACAISCCPWPTAATAAGGYLFGGQGAASRPSSTRRRRVLPRQPAGMAQVAGRRAAADDASTARATWLNARSGNGVFVTAAAAPTAAAPGSTPARSSTRRR